MLFLLVVLGIIAGGWILAGALAHYADKLFFGFVDWYLDFVRSVKQNGSV